MQRIHLYSAGILFSLLWSSAFVAGKVALQYIDPLSLLCWRFATAGFLMLAWVVLIKRQDGLFTRKFLFEGISLGILNNALYLGLSFIGLQTVSPEATVLIVSTAPFITLVISVLMGGPRLLHQFLGIAIGFLGVYIVLSTRKDGSDEPLGMLLVLLGTVAFSIGTIWYKKRATDYDPIALNAVQNITGAIALAFFSPGLLKSTAAFAHVDFLLAYMHLVVFASITSFLIWLALLRKIGAAQAAGFHLLNPSFGILISSFVFGTSILASDVVGSIVVVVGLVVAGGYGRKRLVGQRASG